MGEWSVTVCQLCCLSVANMENTESDHLECICTRVWGGESQVRGCAYEWVRNKAWECPQTSLLFHPAFSSLVWRCWSVPLTKALLRRSGGAHMGRSSELEDPITEHTHGWPRRPCHTHTHRRFFFHHFLWPESTVWLTDCSPLTSQPTHWRHYQQCLRGVPHNFYAPKFNFKTRHYLFAQTQSSLRTKVYLLLCVSGSNSSKWGLD